MLWLGIVAAVLLAALVVGAPPGDGAPLDPRASGPLGTLALVRTLERLGAEVTLLEAPTPDGLDVAVVLADRLGPDERTGLSEWVAGGGTLVVADPSSSLVPVAVVGELRDPRAGGSGCGVDALEGVERLAVDGVGYDLGLAGRGCLGDGDSFFVVATPEGAGTIVAVGGAGAWVNARLGDADNAVLAAALLAPSRGMQVGFVLDPPAGTGTASLQDLVGDGVKQGLMQLGVAFALYALWRGRRLGHPVEEPDPVELSASELVVAVGHLLRQGRHDGRAASTIADDVHRRLAERLGLPPTSSAEVVADLAAARTDLDREHLVRLLSPDPVGRGIDLAAVAAHAHAVDQELTRVR